VGVACLAAWGGVSLGFICYSAFLYKIHSHSVFWIVIVLFGLVFASLTFCIFDPILILSTSMIGSYLVIRGIAFYAGGYPNEFTIQQAIEHNQYDDIPTTFYAYLAGIVFLFVCGNYVQCKHYKNDKKKDNHPYRKYKN